jgi:hypothetical protein
VTRHGKDLVAIELIRYPTRTIEALKGVSGDGVVPGLRTIARDAYDSFEADRRAGCGPDATFDALESTEQLVAGRPGLHWWFALRRGGAVDELVDTYATVLGRRLVIIRYAGYGPDSCLPPEAAAYDPAVLTELRPTLAAAVAGAEL